MPATRGSRGARWAAIPPTACRPSARGACRASSGRARRASRAGRSPPAPRRARRGRRSRRPLPRLRRAEAHRRRQHRALAVALAARVGHRRPRRDVRLDGPARRRLARDPPRGAARARRCGAADAMQGTFIGVLMSATLPARLGEPSRALVVARRLGRAREVLPTVAGIDRVADAAERARARDPRRDVMFSTVDVFTRPQAAARRHGRAGRGARDRADRADRCCGAGTAVALAARRRRRSGAARVPVRQGLRAFRSTRGSAPRRPPCSSPPGACSGSACYILLAALGLDDLAGLGAAAAVLFAVNVTAVLPATPSNLGVFQAACVAVLGALRRRARPTRWPTGSSCRPWRSRPQWSWAPPRW